MILFNYLFNYMSGKKGVPHGVTIFGVVAAGTSMVVANQRSKAQSEINAQFRNEMKNDMNKIKEDLEEIKKGQEMLVKSLDSSKKFINNLDKFSITELFNKTVEFFSGYDILTQTLVFNILCSALLSSLLFSFLFNKFGNYLINKYNLEEKYPKLQFIFNLRLKYQNYYFKYITVISVLTLMFNLFVNIHGLLVM